MPKLEISHLSRVAIRGFFELWWNSNNFCSASYSNFVGNTQWKFKWLRLLLVNSHYPIPCDISSFVTVHYIQSCPCLLRYLIQFESGRRQSSSLSLRHEFQTLKASLNDSLICPPSPHNARSCKTNYICKTLVPLISNKENSKYWTILSHSSAVCLSYNVISH